MDQHDETPVDNRLADLREQLAEDLVDEEGRPPSPAHVEEVLDEKAAAFTGAPVQDFVVLLTEHQAREELREEGFHRATDMPDPHLPGVEEIDEPSSSGPSNVVTPVDTGRRGDREN